MSTLDDANPVFEPLEPRLLLSSAPLAGASGADDCPDYLVAATRVALNGERNRYVSGAVNHSGDADAISFTADRSGTICIDMIRRSGHLDPMLRVYDSSRLLIGTNDNGGTGTNARVRFRVTKGKTYYLSATGGSGTTGTYRLRLGASAGRGVTAWVVRRPSGRRLLVRGTAAADTITVARKAN